VGLAAGVLGRRDAARERARPRRSARVRAVGPVLLAIVVVVTGTVIVVTGGGTLAVAGGGIRGLGVHPAGTRVSQGVQLTAQSARSVVLDHVGSEHSAGVDVHYAIAYTVDAAGGIGRSVGSIAGYEPVPVHGARVGDGSRGVAWLIVSVVPKRPGHWSVTKLTFSYHSWIRHRRTTSSASRFRLEGTAT
jgi:hypothetical protein